MVWVYQRVTYPKLSQTKANKKTSCWLYRFRFKTLWQTVKGQEMIHFSTNPWFSSVQVLCALACAGCAIPSPRGQRSWFPSHSAALWSSSAPAALGSGSAQCAALLNTNVTPGSSNSIVPCHITGCQYQHCHRHEAWPDEVYVTRPPRRRPLL